MIFKGGSEAIFRCSSIIERGSAVSTATRYLKTCRRILSEYNPASILAADCTSPQLHQPLSRSPFPAACVPISIPALRETTYERQNPAAVSPSPPPLPRRSPSWSSSSRRRRRACAKVSEGFSQATCAVAMRSPLRTVSARGLRWGRLGAWY